MKSSKNKVETIDEYIETFPGDIQQILQKIRKTIKKAVPESKEVISYQMPAFKLKSVLVYFAAFKDHIGFFPTPSGIEAFRNELTGYETSKGTIKFPMDEPLPFDLISRITKFRAKENFEKVIKKKKK